MFKRVLFVQLVNITNRPLAATNVVLFVSVVVARSLPLFVYWCILWSDYIILMEIKFVQGVRPRGGYVKNSKVWWIGYHLFLFASYFFPTTSVLIFSNLV